VLPPSSKLPTDTASTEAKAVVKQRMLEIDNMAFSKKGGIDGCRGKTKTERESTRCIGIHNGQYLNLARTRLECRAEYIAERSVP